ncbi:hypothetical protein K450DRAFT_234209 [Umbelopsis ramanniana AG]|uniref:Uncharacterized protein n=1 Tax=Umbelopsis ramanniana AG TaxID=1314678 RepID=A0AAD5HFS3_UMBRA|nr:uncharacterized protein K450DRAFT_234209 [Umbelopsis ramanniana AG]KAI8581011.1 hypothetical protein K450DRAFT_234209 [Umbelopsis ramanniana AG]
MDEPDFTQTKPDTLELKVNSSKVPHSEHDFDDSFGDFHDFEAGNDDFGDFAAGTATSPQPVDGFGTYQHDAIPKSDFHASELDIPVDSSVSEETGQEVHKDEEDIASPTLEAQLTRDETVHEEQDRETDKTNSGNVDSVSEHYESGRIQASSSANQTNIPEQISVEAAPIDDQVSNADSASSAPSPVSNAEEEFSVKDYGPTSKSETAPMSALTPVEAVGPVSNENDIADDSQPSGFSGSTEDGVSVEPRSLKYTNSSIEKEDLGVLDTTEIPDKVDDFETPSIIDNEESGNELKGFHATGVQAEEDQSKSLDTSSGFEKADDFGPLDDVQNKVHESIETTVEQGHDPHNHFDDGKADEFGGFDNDDDQFGADNEFGGFDNDDDQFGDDDEFGGFDDNDEFGDADDFGAFDDNDDDDHFGDFDRENSKESLATSPSDNVVHNNPPVVTPFQEVPVNIKNAIAMSDFGNPKGAFEVWDAVLTHMMPNARDYDSLNLAEEPQAVKDFIMNAHESLLPTITWHALTVDTDDDNGIPKVQWRNSRIEKLHLDALKCWRGNATASPTFKSPKSFSQKGMSPPTSSPKMVPNETVDSHKVTSPVIDSTKVDIIKEKSSVPSPKNPVESSTITKVSSSDNISNALSSKMDEMPSPKLGNLPNLPKIATSKLPPSDSAPTSAASVKSLDMPSISHVVNQIESSTRQSLQQTRSPVLPRQSDSTERQASLDSSNRPPSTPVQSPNLVKRQQSYSDERVRSPSPTPHTLRTMSAARPLTPTRFNPQSRVSSPGPTTASTPDEASPKLMAQSPLNMSAEVLETSTSDSSLSSEKQPAKPLSTELVSSPPAIEHAQTISSPFTSPPVFKSDTMDSWLSSNDMSFLDALGGSTKPTPGSVNSVSQGLKDSSMDIFGGFESATENVPSPNRSSTMPNILQSSNISPSFTESPSTPEKPKLRENDSVDKASPIKSASLPPLNAATNSPIHPHSTVFPNTSPSVALEKRDSWLSSNDMSFLDSFGESVAVKNEGISSNDEFSDFVSQSPSTIPAGQPRSPTQPFSRSPHFTSRQQANRPSQASLSPVATPTAPEKRDSWLSSNDISFLDTLGSTGGNMTSKTNSKSKQIGLGIMDLDMFEANATQFGARARPTPSANTKDSVPSPQYTMPGALSSSSKSGPSWPNMGGARQSQPLAHLQGQPKTTAPSLGSQNSFDGFGGFTGSVVSAQPIPAAHPSSPEDAKWDIFRSASMSGSLSEWSSSLRSPPTAEKMHHPPMQPSPHTAASVSTAAPPALDDFGDFTTADDFGDFSSPDTAWNNASSDGWL